MHSAHSMDLQSRCIVHRSSVTARTAEQAVHGDIRHSHVLGTWFHLEFELSSFSVLSDIIRDVCHFPSAILDCTSRMFSFFGLSQTKANRFYLKQIFHHGGRVPPIPTQVDIALPPCFVFVFAHCARYWPSSMGLPTCTGGSAFPLQIPSWRFLTHLRMNDYAVYVASRRQQIE